MRIIFWILFGLSWSVAINSAEPSSIQPDNYFPKVKLETSLGDIVVELDRTRAPITTNNFLNYVVAGEYDGTIFHRVIKDFVVQGGGYDSFYQPRKEQSPIFNESGNGLKNTAYSIAMAREDDPHSATNQFYFNLSDNQGLDPGKTWGYTVFGFVLEGEEVINAIARTQTYIHPQLGWEDVPQKVLMIKKASLLKE